MCGEASEILTDKDIDREEAIRLAEQVKRDMEANPDKVMYASPVEEPIISDERFIELLSKEGDLTEEESKQLSKRVERDQKNNPDKVFNASPVKEDDFSIQNVGFEFDFLGPSLPGRNHISATTSTLKVRIQTTINLPVTFNLYRVSDGAFMGSRTYPKLATTEATFGVQILSSYRFILTGKDGSWKRGVGCMYH